MFSGATQILSRCSALSLNPCLITLGLLQTCGTPPGADCSETECGGPNCRTDEGQKKCGGPGCGGLVTVAHSAWQKAMDFDRDVLNALAEVEQLSKMVNQWVACFCYLLLAFGCKENLKGRNQFCTLELKDINMEAPVSVWSRKETKNLVSAWEQHVL